MKLNWGASIAIFYITFMIAMISMVVFSTQNRVDMVREDYYQEDLEYEKFRQKRENNTLLEEALVINHLDHALQINFPVGMQNIEGEVTLFRPSDKQLDQSFAIQINADHQMLIPTQKLINGLWKIKIDWRGDSAKYYQETSISL